MSAPPLLLLVVGTLIVLWDAQNVLAWSRRRVLVPAFRGSDDYTVVIPLYGNPAYFDDRARLVRYKPRIVVGCEVGDPRMAAFADRLESEGWRVNKCRLAKPCAPAIMSHVLDAGVVETTYVIRLDADTTPVDDLGRAVAAVERDGADLASVKCHVYRPRTWCERFQALEYRIAMRTRHYRPLLTSGACFIAKTRVLRAIMQQHTMCSYGEDIETGRIAYAGRLRIRHVDAVVETDAPETWRALFRQRRSWWAGTFRTNMVNLDRAALHRPVLTAYYLLLVYFGLAMHVTGRTPHGGEFVRQLPLMFTVYVVLTVVPNWPVRSWLMLVFPVYALVQVTIMPFVGIGWYMLLARRDGHLGRYRFPHRRRRLGVV